jgi:hypothetical protein
VREKQLHVSSDDQVIEELKLFAHAFLQSGEIAKVLGTFGFEKLYENKILSMSHWEDIQQAAFERDLDTLDRAFDAAEEAAKNNASKYQFSTLHRIEYLGIDKNQPHFVGTIKLNYSRFFDDDYEGEMLAPRLTHMTRDEKQRQVSIENANKVLAAVSNNVDTLAKKLLAANGYSGFEQRSVELALRQADFDAARLLISADFPMREAVMAGDLGLVQRLICYEVDPNDGPCFMERPFQAAIMNGNLEIARYLIWRCNIADLGNLRAPLCLALRKGVVEEVQAILNGPRTLTTHDVNGPSATMMQVLRENLRIEHNSFLAASLDTKASVGFQNLGIQLQDYRTLWKMGISAVRRLRKDRVPSDFRQVISLLLVASAMRKTCSIEEFGDYDAFLLDLRRWRYLAVEESRRDVFDELVLCLWGQKMHPIDGDIDDFGKDINFLRAFTREFAKTTEVSSTTDDAVFHEKSTVEQDGVSPASSGASEHHQPETLSSKKDPVPIPETQKKDISCTVAVYLRIGAIFVFFVGCLLGMSILFCIHEILILTNRTAFQGFFIQENDALQSLGLFSSLIDAAYVAPMQLVSPSEISFQSFVELARSRIRAGSICTVTDLDDYMYYQVSPCGLTFDKTLTISG